MYVLHTHTGDWVINRLFLLLLFTTFLSACATDVSVWSYRPGVPRKTWWGERPFPKIAVLPFEDHRSGTNQESWPKAFFLGTTWGQMNFPHPEERGPFQREKGILIFSPSQDLAKAAVIDLARLELFKEVFFCPSKETDCETAQLIMEGRIHSTRHTATFFSYGVGPIAPTFWVFGLPNGRYEHELILDLTLRMIHDPALIWQFTIEKQIKELFWIYNRSADHTAYPRMMQEGMMEAIVSLDETLKVLTSTSG